MAEEQLKERKWEAAAEAAPEALTQDQVLEKAKSVRQSALENTATHRSPSQRWLATYNNWSERNLAPLLELLPIFAVVLSVLLLGARMLTPWANRWPELEHQHRIVSLVVGTY